MWATVATLFAFRDAYQQSVAAALSRTRAAAVSFALLIGVGAVVVTSTGHPADNANCLTCRKGVRP